MDLCQERALAGPPQQLAHHRDAEHFGIRAGGDRPRPGWHWHSATEQGVVDQDIDVDEQIGKRDHRAEPPQQDEVVHSFSARGGSLLSIQSTSRA